MSLVGVIILTAGYEFVRDMSRRFEASSAEYMNKLPSKLSLFVSQSGDPYRRKV